jgi:chromosome segregation protein
MRPLERQAVSARSYVEIEADLRAARQALFAQRLESFALRRRELDTVVATSSDDERDLRNELVTLDAQAAAAAADMASRREELLASTLGTLQGLAERARGTLQVIAERERSLHAALVASADENVTATLEADAARLEADLVAVGHEEGELRAMREERTLAQRQLVDLEAAYEATWGGVSLEGDQQALAAATERRRLLERSIATLTQNQQRADERLADNQRRRDETTGALSKATDAVTAAREHEEQTIAAKANAERVAREAETARDEADQQLRDSTELAARHQARSEALSRALEELSGSGGRALLGNVTGVLGAFLDLIEIDEGWERAVESAVGASVGAMVVDGRTSAKAALELLRREGGAGMILPAADSAVTPAAAPATTVALRAHVRARATAPDHVGRVLDALLARAFVAADWQSAVEVAVAHPEVVVVTRDGDRFAASGWRLASGRSIITRSTVEEAQRSASEANDALEPMGRARQRAQENATTARTAFNAATAAAIQATAQRERAEREVARWSDQARELTERIAALELDVTTTANERAALEVELTAVVAAIPSLEAMVADAHLRAAQAAQAREAIVAQRQHATEVATVLSRREAEFGERRRLLEQRRSEIESRLSGRSHERIEATQRREALEFDVDVLGRLAGLVRSAADDIRRSQEAMDSTYREQLEATRAGAEKLEALRTARRNVEARLGAVAASDQRAQIEQAELAVKVQNLHEAIRRDLRIEPDAVVGAIVELPEGVSLEQRVGDLEARITSLGPINPLALEELAALEERYQDLDTQVADVRHARRELLEVLRALDEEIMSTFSSAVADVNEHFSSLIAMLFPGGQGRLILTEPEDPLNTGVEIEVRPMGRNVRRISLLSGGERSLAALAFLFAVFRSRPSPFYMMDEVEAALDDVNLQRFLQLVDEFREGAQLLIVTHQKRTMEAADALYGVTMVPGASSKVISQRVKRTEGAPTLEISA